MSELYAVHDRDGYKRVAHVDGVPLFNERGDSINIIPNSVLLHGDRCDVIPDFPKPESFKKIKRLSLLPLEVEYEDPPMKIWACTDPDGCRDIRRDVDGDMVYLKKGGFRRWAGGLHITASGKLLDSIPGWPPPGERREIKAIVYMWADEGK